MKKNKHIISLILTYVLIITLNVASVFALDSDMSGGGESSGTESASKGFSVESNIGYRVYVLDSEGNTVADKVTDILYKAPTANGGSWKTQTGSSTSKVETSAAKDMGMPRVIKEEGTRWYSNFDELKAWLISDNDDYGNKNIEHIMKEYLGEDVVEEFNSRDDYYFCIEPIFNTGVFTAGSNSYKGMYYGTSKNWIEFCNERGIGAGTFLGSCIYETMQECIYIDNDYTNLGLLAPSNHSDNSYEEISGHAYGLGLFWNNEGGGGKTPSIHTWDYDLDTQPGKAPLPDDEKNYQDIIICKYYEDYTDGKLIKTESFFRPSEPKLITIEDEPAYKVAEWFTTSDALESKDYTSNWKTSTSDKTSIQNGIKPEEIELNSPEKILFIRLVRGIEVPPRDVDYVLTESEISTNVSIKADGRVRFSLPSEEGVYHVGILATGSNNIFNKFNSSNLVSVYKQSGNASKTLYNLSSKLNIYREGDNLQLADANSDLNDIYNTESVNNRASSDYTKDITISFKNATDYSMSGTLKDKTAKLLVKVYSGSSKEQASSDYDKHEVFNESSYITNTDGKTVEFRPYIKMSYKTSSSDEKQYVNVQGKYIRSLYMPSIVATYYDKQPTLNISSNMWSIDNKLTNGELGWNNKNSVLKYGSVYTLSGINNLKVNTYEIIDLNNSNSANEITANHEDLVNQVYSNLQGTTIKEMFNKNWNEPYYNGSNANEINDADPKYNLQSSEELTGNSSLVELSKNSTETVYWKLSSDTSGNIYLDSSSNLEALKSIQKNKILSQTEDTSSLKDEKAIWFEQQNQLISRFLESIERCTGDDSTADWVSNGHWYNEAVNLYIKSDITSIKVGFDKCKRSLVNGLVVPSESKLDLGTKSYSFGWLLDIPDKKVIAKFNNSDIKLSNPMFILHTKTSYYVTNITVQDNL